jgi:AraC-like DNA-binding protein
MASDQTDSDIKRPEGLPSAAGGVARLAYAQALAAGVPVLPLLKTAGLSSHQIEDGAARINVRAQIAFLDCVADALNDDHLGFHLAMKVDLREIGLLYYVAASSAHLVESMQRVARYSSLVNEGVALKCIESQQVGMAFNYVGVSRHQDRHQIEFLMALFVRMCRHLTGRRLTPCRARFTHFRARYEAGLAELFGEDIAFGAQADEILFDEETRELPFTSADEYLNRLLISYFEEALSRRNVRYGSFRSAVENEIIPLLPHRKIAASDIARRLAMSQRTLSRRLGEENVSFADVLESLRIDLARRYLADKTLSVSQIAWLLGYQEVGSFSHAFKRWTGMSPRQARSADP